MYMISILFNEYPFLFQYEPCKPLFAEMKYCDKKKAVKMTFEFTQAKLSYYKDSKVSLMALWWYITTILDLTAIHSGSGSFVKSEPLTKSVVYSSTPVNQIKQIY